MAEPQTADVGEKEDHGLITQAAQDDTVSLTIQLLRPRKNIVKQQRLITHTLHRYSSS